MSHTAHETSPNVNSSTTLTAAATTEPSVTGLLTGIKVLSLDNYEAGNYGTALLAMHGADVVKVEVPGRGDVLRSAGPFTSGIDERTISHGELRLMRGKNSVALDLSTSKDRAVLEKLIGRADVFWTNLRPRSLERLRLDWPAVRALNTMIVYAGISGFGNTPGSQDTETNTPAFDITMQALGGLLERNQDENGIPRYNGIPVVDQTTSLYAAWGVLAGLLHRARTGTGVYIDVAMYDTALALNEKAITVYGMTRVVPPSQSSATSAPFGVFPARDGFFVLAIGGNPVWERFCDVIARPELKEDPSFRDGTDRVRLAEERLRGVVENWASNFTVEDAVKILIAADVPAAPVIGVEDIVSSEHPYERGILQRVAAPAGPYSVVSSPVRFSVEPRKEVALPHRLGQDLEDVISAWLGDGAEDVKT